MVLLINGRGAELTDSQLQVLEAVRKGRRVIVKACAGSGKTTTLVHAYIDKLKEIEASEKTDDPFNRLLAITFTNEAAVKLKRDVFRGTGGNIRALTNRTISTIHSFCNSVLRENIIEAGISPDYRIAEEYEMADAGEKLLHRIAGENILKDSELRDFVRKYGFEARGQVGNSGFEEMVRAVYQWMRAGGLDIEEGLETLDRRKTSFANWLRKRSTEGDETQSYIDECGRSVALICRYLAEYWRLMELEKREKSVIGYDDIIYYTYRLLKEHGHIRERYRKQFHYVFVDEFQDTDALQLEIVNMISERGKQFFVGDPQQLIYEWRNAKPELFARAESDALDDGDGSSVIYLRENFRSSDGIIHFVNHLFSGLMKEGNMGYVEMEASREDLRERIDDPSVRVFIPKGETHGELCASEAAMIASEISRVIEQGTMIVDMHEHTQRKAKYSDIALLFRSRSSVKVYEQKLEAEGIPFIGLQESTFFKRPEIVALRDFILHMAGPSDAFYTASVMRSPLFDVRDDTIVSSATCNFDIDEMRKIADETGDSALAGFVSFESWWRSAAHMHVSEMLLELIRKTGFDAICLAGGRGVDAYAGAVRFIELVRRFESDGMTGPADVADELKQMEERRAEPDTLLYDESSNAVRLMTVHEAKGLEFPIVFIARSFSRTRADNYDMLIDRDFGIILREMDTDSNPLRAFYVDVEKDLRKRKAPENEEKRIFYVAATRAQQQLYISANAGNAGSWSGELWKMLGAAGINMATESGGIVQAGGGHVLLLPAVRYSRKEQPRSRSDIQTDKAMLDLDMSLSRRTERFAMSPTELAGYMVCHYRASLSARDGAEGAAGSMTGGVERGSMIHGFLEHYDYIHLKEPEFLKSAFGEKYDEIAACSAGFLKSTLGTEAAAAAADGRLFRELPFSAVYGRGLLSGKVDMVIPAGSECTIVDYKSGRADTHAEEYRNQLLIYASAVMKITGCESIRLFNFFVDEKEPVRGFTARNNDIETFDAQLEASMEAYDSGDREASPSMSRCSCCVYRSTCQFRFGNTE